MKTVIEYGINSIQKRHTIYPSRHLESSHHPAREVEVPHSRDLQREVDIEAAGCRCRNWFLKVEVEAVAVRLEVYSFD